jgi:CII-binding regulator of phage lambda lysogenization HflD
VQYSAVKNVEVFLAALRQSVEEVKQLPPIDVASMKAKLNALLASNDPALFEKAAAMVGIQGQNLPPGMAMISTLLESMPDEVQSQFLIEYFNNLYA